MGVEGGSGNGGTRWPLGMLGVLAALIGAIWLLGWRDSPPETTSTTSAPTPTTTIPTTATATVTADGRIDIMGVVVAVEPGAEWITAPVGICPNPERPTPSNAPHRPGHPGDAQRGPAHAPRRDARRPAVVGDGAGR